ncbi:MAG: hypothetical protein ACKO8Z_15230, partial [Prosthecobacter sp.]
RHSLVSDCPNSLLALSLPLKPPRSPVISDIVLKKRSMEITKHKCHFVNTTQLINSIQNDRLRYLP